MFRTRYSAATDVGLQRDNNEDAFYASSKDGLWVVADGMGGHAAGEVASAIVIQTIQREISAGNSLQDAVKMSHIDILKAANSGIGGMGMGSTVVALKTQMKQFEICWVGDSRAYLFTPSGHNNADEGDLQQLSTDHSYVQMLYQSGAITEEELHTHPERNIITQCLGSVELNTVNVDRVSGEWQANCCILLCSDGLSDVVSDREIATILGSNTHLDERKNALINAALEAGGKDNITVCLVEAPSSTQLWLNNVKDLFSSNK